MRKKYIVNFCIQLFFYITKCLLLGCHLVLPLNTIFHHGYRYLLHTQPNKQVWHKTFFKAGPGRGS